MTTRIKVLVFCAYKKDLSQLIIESTRPVKFSFRIWFQDINSKSLTDASYMMEGLLDNTSHEVWM